ncbi:hypothetical protein M3Y98_00004800 [Aphelenchoides besseyi]|nr:hypothetical protein M3Y98_00004800 [Aphelenchoides besseyi]KAI6199372.1 hypothetical protein M3Y96_00620100 [Aphelenchoides besseyi]
MKLVRLTPLIVLLLCTAIDGVAQLENNNQTTNRFPFDRQREVFQEKLTGNSQQSVLAYQAAARYLHNIQFGLDPCTRFGSFVCPGSTSKRQLNEDYVFTRVVHDWTGRDDVSKAEANVFRFFWSCNENASQTMNTVEFYHDTLAKFENRTGISFPLLDGLSTNQNITIDAKIWAKVAAFLKTEFNHDFLINFSVKAVDKVGRDRDIFFHQAQDSLPDDLEALGERVMGQKFQNVDGMFEKIKMLDSILQQRPKSSHLKYLSLNALKGSTGPFFIEYIVQLISRSVRTLMDPLDLFFYVENIDDLQNKLNFEGLRKHFEKSEFEEVVMNYLNFVVLAQIDQVVKKFQPNVSPFNFCQQLTFDLMPEITQRLVTRRLTMRFDERASVKSKFNVTVERVKFAFTEVVGMLSGISEEAKNRILTRVTATNVQLNGISNYEEDDDEFDKSFEGFEFDINASFHQMFVRALAFKLDSEFRQATIPTHPLYEKRGMSISLLSDLLELDIDIFLSAGMPDELWYGHLGPEIAKAIWTYAAANETEVQNLFKSSYACFNDNYNINARETVIRINENVIALKIAYSAFTSHLAQNGICPALSGPELQQLRPEQLFFISAQRKNCRNQERAIEFGIRNNNEFRSSFNCPATTSALKCSLIQFNHPIKAPEYKRTLNIPTPKIRSTPLLDQLSANIEARINTSVDPCENFYDYVCSNRPKNTFEQAMVNNMQIIKNTLAHPPTLSDVKAVIYMKNLYKKCVKDGLADSAFTRNELMSYMKNLNAKTGLKFPILPAYVRDENFIANLLHIAALIQRDFGIVSFIEITSLRLKSDMSIVELGMNEVGQAKALKRTKEEREELWKQLVALGYKDAKIPNVLRQIDQFREILKSIASAQLVEPSELRKKVGVDMELFLDLVFERSLPNNTAFVVSGGFSVLAVKSSVIRAGAINAILEDLLYHLLTTTKIEATLCDEKIAQLMPFFAGRILADRFPTKTSQETFLRPIRQYINAIKLSYMGMINSLVWLEDYSKEAAINKLKEMTNEIAFPPILVDDNLLEEATKFNKFNLLHPIKYAYHDNEFMLLRISIYDEKCSFILPVPAAVNAAYVQPTNMMLVPIAILIPPFYHTEYPMATIMGALGTIIGHEIGHALDTKGIYYNGNGTRLKTPWLSKKAMNELHKVFDCIEEQYRAKCKTSEDSETPYCIDALTTLGEDFSDNAGIRAAYRAFRNMLSINGPDDRLSGELSRQLTSDQLFFVSFAQNWCTESDFTENLFASVHSPNRARVNGVLENFAAFRDAFSCEIGGRYGSVNQCKVWADEISDKLKTPFDVED